jgi:hypothetical protein
MAAVPQHRQFPSACEMVAAHWRVEIESPDDWSPRSTGENVGGESAGYFVTCGPLNAYAKPSKIDRSREPVPRAAHEKIAADLACDLGLPVPPAVLKRWGTPPPACDQPCVVCGLMPFFPVYKWAAVKAVPELEASLKGELRHAASAMVPFDTWLANTDRNNDGNLLISRSTVSTSGKLHVAYIDFSYSMSHSWRPDFRTVTPVGAYPIDPKDIDPVVTDSVVAAIEMLGEEHIRSVVGRLPDEFLSPAGKTLITDGLLYRQSKLRAALNPDLGARP